ncbi:MAG: PaaI family thioesterase [Dehalococcoidia bacterium]|nr:PaaI family thioesterase [Dehalococcoidia bacterium]
MTNWPRPPANTTKESDKCFVCGPKNPIGLKLNFSFDGQEVKANFTPGEYHQGWAGLVHGGIISCLLDEAMSYAALYSGVNSLTARMQTRFKRSLPIDEPLTVTGSVTRKTRRLVETKAELKLADDTLVAESTATMFIFLSEREPRVNA